MVKVNVKPDCGNAPKKLFLRDYHIALANHNREMILESVDDNVQWEVVGKRTVKGKAEFERMLEDRLSKKLEVVTIDNIITHGNAASVNGTWTEVEGATYGFCDVYTFSSSAKNAKIKTITSYLIKRTEIRAATLSDIPGIRAVGAASWRATYKGVFPDQFIENVLAEWWSEASLQRVIPNHALCNLVAVLDGEIIGVLAADRQARDQGQAHLYRLYVHPDYFGQGIGTRLWQRYLTELEQGVTQVDLQVEPQNDRAIRFYKGLGFTAGEIEAQEAFGYTMRSMHMHLLIERKEA